ncbi:helix-turn-helix transcriptional regulator [Rhizobium sp. S163]|uniref:helix-turn-helix domain-containing protein n=1 Tax=Rhizobium sp. S163 TaxID=3055039 RepID=UPI0025A97A97|nr:helix-turn-helix transcriptional regulator [Rhizobium sp. S163]MDM9645595.1 helix-turn-helix transcriptional regulator [Rhizobium sp. S163]
MNSADQNKEEIEVNNKLGRRIRMARKTLGLSQTHLGNALGVSFQQIGKYESGKNSMSVSTFLTICRTLRLKPSSLLDDYLGQEKP